MQTIAIIIVLQIIVTLLTGCSQLESKFDQVKKNNEFESHDTTLICRPVDAIGCIGWAGNK